VIERSANHRSPFIVHRSSFTVHRSPSAMRLNTYNKVNLIAAYYFLAGGFLLILAAGSLIIPVSAAVLGASEFLARLPGWFLGSTADHRWLLRGAGHRVPGHWLGAVAAQAVGAPVGHDPWCHPDSPGAHRHYRRRRQPLCVATRSNPRAISCLNEKGVEDGAGVA
jgi:hypothetical protein